MFFYSGLFFSHSQELGKNEQKDHTQNVAPKIDECNLETACDYCCIATICFCWNCNTPSRHCPHQPFCIHDWRGERAGKVQLLSRGNQLTRSGGSKREGWSWPENTGLSQVYFLLWQKQATERSHVNWRKIEQVPKRKESPKLVHHNMDPQKMGHYYGTVRFQSVCQKVQEYWETAAGWNGK